MKRIVLIIAAALAAVTAGAQTQKKGEIGYRANKDISAYISDTLLYVSPVFADGRVVFRDFTSSAGKLNISTVNQNVLFLDPATGDTLALSNEADVKYAIISGKTYYKTKFGYAQTIRFSGDRFFCVLKNMILEQQQAMTSYGRIPASSTAKNVNTIRDLGGTSNSSEAGQFVDVKYEMQVRPVLMKGTKSYLATRKGFYKVFSDRKDDVDRLASELNTDFDDPQSAFDLFEALIALQN